MRESAGLGAPLDASMWPRQMTPAKPSHSMRSTWIMRSSARAVCDLDRDVRPLSGWMLCVVMCRPFCDRSPDRDFISYPSVR